MSGVNLHKLQSQLSQHPINKLASKTKNHQQRERYLSSAMRTGGRSFLRRVQKFGSNEKGSPLILRNHYCEYLQLIADFRISWVLTTGPSQVGKTIGHTLVLIDAVVCGKLNGGWFYDSRTSLDQYAPMQFRPPADAWITRMEQAGYRFSRGDDRAINTRYQVDGANAIFTFLSTSKMSRADSGGAAAAAAASSFPADLAIMEERSQSPPGAADVCLDRLSNSIVPTKPRRDLGTPGGGMGIEIDMGDCDHHFYPHYDCSHCGQTHPLDPKGCLLKEADRTDLLGNVIKTYLSETGRPIEWWSLDETDPTNTAYIACAGCGQEIGDEIRLEKSYYKCLIYGTNLHDFLKNLAPGQPERSLKIGLHMSPLTREGKGRQIAIDIIQRGNTTSNPANWQQQGLGHYSITDSLRITRSMIGDRIGAKPPAGERYCRLAGVDCGRGEDWLIIIDFYLPSNFQGLSVAQISEIAAKHIVYDQPVARSAIPSILQEWHVDFGFIDNEPSIESVMMLCSNTCLQMANQVGGATHTMKYTKVIDGGVEAPCWAIRNEKFMLSVFHGFAVKAWDGEIAYRCPATWEKWLNGDTDRSPIVHLSAPWRDIDSTWHRPNNKVDDYYMAALFAEAAFYLVLTQHFTGQTIVQQGTYIN
jgi:hypothetical protein